MNSNKQTPNQKNTEMFVKKTTETLKKGVEVYVKVRTIINNTPIQIRIANIIVPFVLTYIFTYIYYNLALSISFAIITFFFIFIMSKISALIFITLYVVSIVNVYNQLQQTIGKPISKTDIVNGSGPWICNKDNNNALTISHSSLPQDLNGGYFSYYFWLYVKDTNYSSDPTKGFRINEWKSVFFRGTQSTTYDGLLQYPGFWLSPKLNNLVIVFQEGNIVERIELINIPINEWFNVCCIVESKSVSIYINGLLDRTLSLNQSIKIMNNYDLFLTSDSSLSSLNPKLGGFDGSLAELIFYNYALTPDDVYKSYLYYLPYLNNYQNKLDSNNYNTSSLITNSDYNEMCGNSCGR